jgi:hypothetical protein
MTHRTRPATVATADRSLRIERLGSRLDPPNTPNAAPPQAPDDRGESDYAFFLARPGVNTRIRLPFPNEFVLEPGRGAVVTVLIERDDAGQPKRRARRRLRFCEGGTA